MSCTSLPLTAYTPTRERHRGTRGVELHQTSRRFHDLRTLPSKSGGWSLGKGPKWLINAAPLPCRVSLDAARIVRSNLLEPVVRQRAIWGETFSAPIPSAIGANHVGCKRVQNVGLGVLTQHDPRHLKSVAGKRKSGMCQARHQPKRTEIENVRHLFIFSALPNLVPQSSSIRYLSIH